jgi:hypothetical protein
MDTIQFHWNDTFKYFFKENSKIEKWFNPSKSWTNKLIFNSKILTWILSVPLVFITDFWHLLKFLFLNTIFIGFIILVLEQKEFKDILAGLIICNVVWGIFFETILRVYVGIGDSIRMKKNK